MKNNKKLLLILCTSFLPTLALAGDRMHTTTMHDDTISDHEFGSSFQNHDLTAAEKKWVDDFVKEHGYYVDNKTARAYGGVGNYIDRRQLELVAHQKMMAARWDSENVTYGQSSWAYSNGVRLRFPVDSADVSDSDRRRLRELGREMSMNRDIEVRLNGYADSTGPDSYNNVLSRRRADAVATVLKSAGAPSSQIKIRAYGEEDPIASNDTNTGRAMNRRVEVRMEDALAE